MSKLIDVTKKLYSLMDEQLNLVCEHGTNNPMIAKRVYDLERQINKLCEWRVRMVGVENLTNDESGVRLIKDRKSVV